MSKIVLLVAFLAQDSAELSRRAFADLPADGTLAVAGQAVSWKDLSAALKRHATSGIRQLVLRVDGTVPFSSVQQLMAAAREAGIEGVQFSPEKPLAALRLSAEAHRSVRIKLREGPKGLELLVLQESSAVSLDDLRKKLQALEKGPVVIDAEFEVPYGAVQQVVAACAEEGFAKVSFAGAARKPGAIRVLYAEQEPRHEFRYLRNLLERSPEVRLDVHLAAAGREVPGSLPAFPADLSAYDVVLMGELAVLDADRRKALIDFVQRGGAVVWMGPEKPGPEWLGHALEPVCPVKVKRGTEGRIELHAATVTTFDSREAGTLDWNALKAALTADAGGGDAMVFVRDPAGQDKRPSFLVAQKCGKGRALYVGAGDTWRWREGTGDQPRFAPFWTGALKWAAGR